MFLIKTFEIDVTPQNNKFGLLASATPIGIETPIYLRGLLLSDAQNQYVICSVEYCIISGCYYQDLMSAISKGTDTPMNHVTLHTSHQHDVPFFDELYHGIMEKYGKPVFPKREWDEYVKEIQTNIEKEISQPTKQVTHVSFQNAEVHEYASDRRIYKDGKMNWRGTKCQNLELKALPVGEIDPNLYQCVFWGENSQPLVTLNFYASHPQVADGRGLLSSDAPGVALKKMKTFLPNTFHIYFDGCGGDIGNGKFAGPSKDADLEVFGEKLFKGMQIAFQKAQPESLKSVRWLNHTFDLPFRKPVADANELRAQIATPDFSTNFKRFYIARNLGLIEKNNASYPFRISRLCLNQNQIFFLPGEMFLTYQKYCIEKSNGKTCVAAYGDDFIGYVPEDADFALGGYEIDGAFQNLMPGCEKLIKKEMNTIING